MVRLARRRRSARAEDEAWSWRGEPGRQIHTPVRADLSLGHPGAGAAADDAARARPRGGAEHRRLHLRLSRLAARRLRQRAVAGAAAPRPKRHRFQPGLNEDLAATAVWGSQQVNLFPGAKVDGVFGIWYGKGPGVDRSVDVLQACQLAPAPRRMAACWRSPATTTAANPRRTAHQSEQMFEAAMMPVLNPATVQEYLDFGLLRLRAVALFRLLGRLQGDRRDGRELGLGRCRSAARRRSCMPHGFRDAAGRPQHPLAATRRWSRSARLHGPKMAAVAAFARANALDRIVIDRRSRASASSPPARPISTCARR